MGMVEMDRSSPGQQPLKPEDLYGHSTDFSMGGQDFTRSQVPPMGHPPHPAFPHGGDSLYQSMSPMCPVTTLAEHQHHHHHLHNVVVSSSAAAHGLSAYSTEGHPQIYSHYVLHHPPSGGQFPLLPTLRVPPSGMQSLPPPPSHLHPHPPYHLHENDCDPLELERFAERFKQRRIKLGVTQADVGSALAELKIPGVGSLSQSTICRFESLTLSHNNMIALKPILLTWLEEAEQQAYERKMQQEVLDDKKRKRTSIAAPEKRSLEAYFAIQPRPSGEKIAQIADKLGLKKNVVRVWFCNQRQKQKRMKFSAVAMGHH